MDAGRIATGSIQQATQQQLSSSHHPIRRRPHGEATPAASSHTLARSHPPLTPSLALLARSPLVAHTLSPSSFPVAHFTHRTFSVFLERKWGHSSVLASMQHTSASFLRPFTTLSSHRRSVVPSVLSVSSTATSTSRRMLPCSSLQHAMQPTCRRSAHSHSDMPSSSSRSSENREPRQKHTALSYRAHLCLKT
jgi:hypothetical protein